MFPTKPIPDLSAKDIKRFLSRVEKGDCCWLWRASRWSGGYGRFAVSRKQFGAHRISHAIFKGAPPPDLQVLHTCDNPPCVNPDHLSLGTIKDNMADVLRRNRRAHVECRLAKLTAEQVRHIRASDRTCGELSNIYGVERRTIARIILRKTWNQ